MSRRADLEAEIIEAGTWNLEQLAVYADELQQRGDPRGELIAIDVAWTRGTRTPDLDERRRGLVAALLGDRASDPAIQLQYGFVQLELDDTRAIELIAQLGPLAPYLRAVRVIASEPSTIADAIGALSIAPRPWLTHLSIVQRRIGQYPIVSSRAAAALADAAPRLDTLEVTGDGTFASFEHPALRSLRITGIDAILSLRSSTAPLPRVTELDLRTHAGLRLAQRTDEEWSRYLPPALLPALRRLDLSRSNAAVAPADLDAFRFLRQAPIAPQLTELRLPALRGAGDLANAQAALDRIPELALLEVVPGSQPGELTHPRATIRGLHRPWHGTDRTMATIVVGERPIRIVFAEAIDWLEQHYERMSRDERAAWDYLWDVLLRQPRGRRSSRALFAELAARALASCHGWVWPELHAAVHAHDHGPGVMLAL